MPHPLDATAVHGWCALGRAALRARCARMDAINVFPVADGDTGTNLCLTFEAAADALREPVPGAGAGDEAAGPHGAGRSGAGRSGAGRSGTARSDAGRSGTGQDPAGLPGAGQESGGAGPGAGAAAALRVMARAALLDARGNSGTILAEYLRGMAEGVAEATARGEREVLVHALRGGAGAAYAAVAHPVEGTMLTVAAAAADAAGAGRDPFAAAREALAATPGQLAALADAGVVDAGAVGLTALLDALRTALTGETAEDDPGLAPAADGAEVPADRTAAAAPAAGPEFEVMYLIEAADPSAIQSLKEALDPLGDSLVIGGGDGLWSVHVHVADAGAAVEAGLAAGRPYRIRIAHLPGQEAAEQCAPEAPARAVVAVVPGDGLAGLCTEAGAAVVPAADATRGDALLAAVRATGAREVVLLPNGAEFHPAAVRAAEEARTQGVRTAVIPTRAAVQGIAALAVHAPGARFDEDVVAMTSAAGATRYGEVTVAARESWTMAGICQAGDVLGLVEGDVAVIGTDLGEVAADVLVRMLAAGGEMVTLVLGEGAPEGLARALESYVSRSHLAVDTVVYEGRQQSAPLLIGVE